MALGGNLKKKSLIPKTEEKENKSSKKKSNSPAKQKKKVNKKPAEKPLQKSATRKPVAKKATTEKKAAKPKKVKETVEENVVTAPRPKSIEHEKPAARAGLLSKMEYERRQKLHEKFTADVKELDGKQVHMIVFRIEQEEFALEISKVNEVVVTPKITRMPQAPKYVPGIATIRGKGVVTLDLAYKLGYVDSAEKLSERSEYTIVIKTNRFTVGVLVPEVPVSQVVAGNRIQTADDSVSETSLDETYIKGLIRTKDRLIFYIDIDEMIEGDRLKARLVE